MLRMEDYLDQNLFLTFSNLQHALVTYSCTTPQIIQLQVLQLPVLLTFKQPGASTVVLQLYTKLYRTGAYSISRAP